MVRLNDPSVDDGVRRKRLFNDVFICVVTQHPLLLRSDSVAFLPGQYLDPGNDNVLLSNGFVVGCFISPNLFREQEVPVAADRA